MDDHPEEAVDSMPDTVAKALVDSNNWGDSNNAAAAHEEEEAEAPEAAGQYTWKRSDGRSQGEDDASEDDDDDENEGPVSGATAGGASSGSRSRAVPSGIDDLPLFADAKNKKLHQQIRKKETQFQNVVSEISETVTRVEIMGEHLKNVKQELFHTQELQTAKQKELLSETHMKQLAEREIGRVSQELKKFDVECGNLENKISTIQNFLFSGNAKMDTFKLQMNWNQDEMEQWVMAAKQKEDDTMALEKYKRADESKIKELVLEIEKLTKILQNQRTQVDDEATETQAKQIELDKTANEFRQLHLERQKLITQWQETIETMQKRDEEIQNGSEQFAQARNAFLQKKTLLNEQKHRLKTQESENDAMQNKISAKERQQSKTQQEFQNVNLKLQEFKDQVELLKAQLASAVTHLNQQRAYNTNKDSHLENLKNELEQARAKYKTTKKALELCLSSTFDAETLAKNAETDLTEMENALLQCDKEISFQKDQMFRKSQQLFQLRQKEANLIAEISGAKAASQNLHAKMKILDQNALRQQELVYNGEFQIQQMERKVARASGERSVDETKILQAQIQVLQMELDRVKAEQSMLLAQCKKVDDEKKSQERIKKNLVLQKQDIETTIAQVELANESVTNSLKMSLKEKEELLVQHDLQSLEVQRLQKILNLRADEVFSLENRDFQLKKSMEARKKEIQMQKEIQRANIKSVDEERHKVAVELSERENRVQKLQAKFEIICKMSGFSEEDANGGEGGGERSQAYFVIKAAQHREELQREGDELDDKIRLSEKEVKALKKALTHLDDRNSEYRKSFHKADLASDDAQKMALLEDHVKQCDDLFFKKKKELTRVEMDFESELNRLKEMETQKSFAKENVFQLQMAFTQIEKEVSQERTKFNKITKKMDKQLKAHSKNQVGGNTGMMTKEQVQLETFNLKEISASLLYTLGQLAVEFPEISDLLQVAVKEHGLHIPAMPPGRIAAARGGGGGGGGAGGEYGLPRPLSAHSDKSDMRSVKSSGSSIGSQRSTGSSHGSSSSARIAAPVKNVRIGF